MVDVCHNGPIWTQPIGVVVAICLIALSCSEERGSGPNKNAASAQHYAEFREHLSLALFECCEALRNAVALRDTIVQEHIPGIEWPFSVPAVIPQFTAIDPGRVTTLSATHFADSFAVLIKRQVSTVSLPNSFTDQLSYNRLRTGEVGTDIWNVEIKTELFVLDGDSAIAVVDFSAKKRDDVVCGNETCGNYSLKLQATLNRQDGMFDPEPARGGFVTGQFSDMVFSGENRLDERIIWSFAGGFLAGGTIDLSIASTIATARDTLAFCR